MEFVISWGKYFYFYFHLKTILIFAYYYDHRDNIKYEALVVFKWMGISSINQGLDPGFKNWLISVDISLVNIG